MKRFILILLVIVSISCRRDHSNYDTRDSSVLVEDGVLADIKKDSFENSFDSISNGLPIFYNMFLTVEMATLFQSVDAVFSEDIINPTNKRTEYLTSSKMALNLGIYAVDLSYTRVFDQLEYTRNYLQTMQSLASDLGIPEEYFLLAASRFEKNVANKDSLYKIANEVYFTSDEYLKDNERESAALLIVLGGWIEAMYIGTNTIYKGGKDIELLDRLVEQKYSLEMIVELLLNYKDDLVVKNYLSQLNELIKIYQNFEVDYDQVEMSVKDFKKISVIINKIRADIVS